MGRPNWVPPEVDITRPSIARVYDYYLGGSHNFRADREAARRALAAFPGGRQAVYEFRAFLRRAVRFCVDQGITQFLDLGSGIPTVGNVHEVAQARQPEARVVYVDVDPVAVAHSRAILAGNRRTAVLHADIRDADRILDGARELLDPDRPVAVLMLAVLPFVSDADDPVGLVGRFGDAMAPGSHLVISHATRDDPSTADEVDGWSAEYNKLVAHTTMRSRSEVAALFAGFDLVEPGLVWLSQWRPEPESSPPETMPAYGAVGCRR